VFVLHAILVVITLPFAITFFGLGVLGLIRGKFVLDDRLFVREFAGRCVAFLAMCPILFLVFVGVVFDLLPDSLRSAVEFARKKFELGIYGPLFCMVVVVVVTVGISYLQARERPCPLSRQMPPGWTQRRREEPPEEVFPLPESIRPQQDRVRS
jgi:hypothetical protein